MFHVAAAMYIIVMDFNTLKSLLSLMADKHKKITVLKLAS